MYISDLEIYYTGLFRKLHTKVTQGQKAPHKPILLLSVIDLIETGVITDCFIPFSQEIESQFMRLWIRYIGVSDSFQPKSSVPFWHMDYEPFWDLILKDGVVKSFDELAEERAYGDFKKMQKVVIGAKIDDDLLEVLQDPSARARLRVELIKGYL